MIEFNELRIDPKSNKLIIDAKVKDLSYYNDVYIKSVNIDNQDTYVSSGVSTNPLYTKVYNEYPYPSTLVGTITVVDYWQDYDDESELELDYILQERKSFKMAVFKDDERFMLTFSYFHCNTEPMASDFKSLKFVETESDEGIKLIPKDEILPASKFTYDSKYYDFLLPNYLPYTIYIPSNLLPGNYLVKIKYEIATVSEPWNPFIDTATLNIEVHKSIYSTKNIRLELDKVDLKNTTLENNMFFVYLLAVGTPASDTPCGMDNEYTIGVALDTCPIYNNMLANIKELNNQCKVPKNLINSFLLFKALLIAIKTEHYQEAINYYNKFFLNKVETTSNCGCYGGHSL